jgi:hypothetical protein
MWWGGLNKFCLLSYLFSFFFKVFFKISKINLFEKIKS